MCVCVTSNMADGADVLFSLCCFFALLGHTPVVTVPVNTVPTRRGVNTSRTHFQDFKTLLKRAIRSGKIRRVVEEASDECSPLSTGECPTFQDLLNQETWSEFQDEMCAGWDKLEKTERLFRKYIRTKHPHAKVKYVHGDYWLW